jgi:hypothetical protein
MSKTRTLLFASGAAMGLAWGGVAGAVDTCSGYEVNVSGRDVSITQTVDAGDPRRVMVGACDFDGRCIHKDKDGDDRIVDLAYVPGDDAATWKDVGGNGKYANAAGSGWYKQIRMDGDVRVFVWSGDCETTTQTGRETRMTRADLQATFENALVTGMCTDATLFSNRYGAGGLHEHTTTTIGGQVLFRDDRARWAVQDDPDGASLCLTWSSGGTSCWRNYRLADRYVGREVGGQGRSCWFAVTPQ